MKSPTSVTWPIVGILAVCVGGILGLILVLPAGDPNRGVIITAVVGAVVSVSTWAVGAIVGDVRRQVAAVSRKTDQIIASNGNSKTAPEHGSGAV